MTHIVDATAPRGRALLIGCSTLALLASAAADAACTPSPTQPGTTTTCDGVETAGLAVGSTGAVVVVGPAAAVTAPAGVPAIAVTAAPPAGSYATLAATINVAGRVDGGTASGIRVTPGAPAPSYYYVYYTETAVNVGPGGVVTGVDGIAIVRNPASPYTPGRVTLTNNGAISGTSGVALLASDPTIGSFSIVNTGTGTIGAINAAVVTLDNSGTIDGGGLSALATPATPYYYSGYTSVTNGGTIRSTSAADTIALRADYSYPSVANTGTIANGGSGAALGSTGSIGLTNAAGASVTAAGAVAIRAATSVGVTNNGTIGAGVTAIDAGGTVNVTNRGTIVGDIRSSGGGYYSASTVDTGGGGTIAGNIVLGAGDDTVAVDYSAATTFTGISGTVDAGGGTNTLRLVFATGTTLAAPVTLPATFQQLVYSLGDTATLTLAPGFSQSATVFVTGDGSYGSTGTLINNATLATSGRAIAQQYPGITSLTLVNNGSITATLAQPYDAAVALSYNYGPVTNTGSITAFGGRALDLSGGTLTNSGAIAATGDAVTGFNTALANTGSIVSTAGIGFVASGSGTVETNRGTISGATAGAQIFNVALVNTGTITSPVAGVALGGYGIVDNRAGGVVTGGVAPSSSYGYGYTYNAKVINAGTINGDVNFGSAPFYYGSSNVFIAQPGGVVNGNLFLGSGNDVFVTSLTNTGPGAFAGVTGTVTGSGREAIRYLVATSASAVVAPAGIFARAGYELAAGTMLTLTAPAPQTLGIEFAGSGTVDLTADLAQTDAAVIDLTAQSALVPSYPPVSNAIALTSHGTLAATSTLAAGYYAPPAVQVGAGSSFTNAGTIVLHGAGAGLTGVVGGGSVINSGTISLDGATAIGGTGGYDGTPLTVINRGTITQVAGGATSTGIAGATAITNSGSIVVGGPAINPFGYGGGLTVTNSGTLRSTGGAAISAAPGYYSGGTVTNAHGGTIAGVGAAIVLTGGGVIDNSGVIAGDVVLGCSGGGYCFASGSSIYVARAGSSLTGNLTFGPGDDIFIALDAATGVTGTVDGGGGTNTYARAYATTTTVAAGSGLPASFQREGIGASGAATVVTVTGPATGLDRGLFFFGDGQIVNAATVKASAGGVPNTVDLGGPPTLAGVGSTLAFVNQATLADGVAGDVRSFANSGTIASAANSGAAVSLTAPGDRFDFTNSGTIAAQARACDDYYYCPSPASVVVSGSSATPAAVTVTNSGTLTGAIAIGLAASTLTFDNSGTVADVAGATYASINHIDVYGGTGFNAANVAVTNRGTIANGIDIAGAARAIGVVNSGTVGATYGSALGVYQQAREVVGAAGAITRADQDSATIVNGGTVTGTIQLFSHATATSLTNSGTVTAATAYYPTDHAVTVSARTIGSQAVTVANTGSVTEAVAGGAALTVTGTATAGAATSAADGPAATIGVTNSGILRADGGGLVTHGADLADSLTPAFGLSVVAASDAASAVTITNAAGGLISATGAPSLASGPGPVAGAFATGGSVALFASGTTVAITNAGTIGGGRGTAIAADALVAGLPTLPDAYLAGAVATLGSVDTLVNAKTGVITGSVDLGAFDDRIENYGTITGDVFLRDGTDSFVQSLGATFTGTADGGAGSNTLILDATGGGALTQALLDRFVNFAAPTITGSGTITTTGPLRLPTLTVTGGTLTIAAGSTLATMGPVTITAGDADVTIVNLGTVAGGIAFGGGSDGIDNRGAIGGDLVLGGGATVVTNSGTVAGAVTGGGPVSLTNSGILAKVALGSGPATVGNSGTIGGGVTGSGSVVLTNGGTIVGGVRLGDGSVQLTNGGRIDAITLGDGPDALGNTGTISGAVTFGNGGNTLTNGGTLAGPVRFGSGPTTVVNSGTITGALTFGNGPTALTTSGPIAAPVAFGSGNDTLTLQHGGRVGAVDGGAGSDTLVLALGGSDATPDEVTLADVTGFERLRVTSGVAALSEAYATGLIDVAAGRLIGRAGSTLAAPTITVAPGAIFGSAGTVVGALAVAGTLSPGASPGTMTVIGNVTLAAGSTALFELTPTVSDQLLVSGTLTIAPGASLTLTGTRPLTPGTPLDLIVAGGGIGGSFATVTQAPTIVGFLRQSATRLQLFGQFALDPALNPGAARGVTYVNALLTGGTASAALLAAVPALLTPAGATNGSAFALLTPEAYASASRIGTENGLTVAHALRTAADGAVPGRGLFTFVQGVGAWRALRGDGTAGRADVDSGGVIGGVGFGHGSVGVSVFGGYLDGRQSVGALGARTVATGAVAGISGTASTGAFGALVTLACDGSDAQTTRAVPGATARAAYALHGFVADGRLTYALPLGAVSLVPEVGVTHVTTRRGGAVEGGSAAFGLTVAARTDRADFVDAALRIAPARPAAFAPWAALGVRHQLDGRDRLAVAAFGGGAAPLIAPGVAAAATLASVAAGFGWQMSAPLTLYGAYRSEFARGDTATSATVGARFRF